MTEKTKSYYSSREAAELLGVAVSTIQLWTNNGILQAWTTAGGHRRIECGSVDEMLAEQKAATHIKKTDKVLSVAIVEDDLQQLRLYEKQFGLWQMNTAVTTSENGYEGLIKIGCTLPDVIITDLIMPKMDGFQMVSALKKLPELEHTLIIVVTGLTDDDVSAKGGLPDGVHLLTKPLAFEKIKLLLLKETQINAL
jgi:excisionase family DNA binding protein